MGAQTRAKRAPRRGQADGTPRPGGSSPTRCTPRAPGTPAGQSQAEPSPRQPGGETGNDPFLSSHCCSYWQEPTALPALRNIKEGTLSLVRQD